MASDRGTLRSNSQSNIFSQNSLCCVVIVIGRPETSTLGKEVVLNKDLFNQDLLDAIAIEIGSLVYEDDRLKAAILALKAEVEELKAKSTNLEFRTDKTEADMAELKVDIAMLKSSVEASAARAAELHKEATRIRFASAQIRAKSVASRIRAVETRKNLPS